VVRSTNNELLSDDALKVLQDNRHLICNWTRRGRLMVEINFELNTVSHHTLTTLYRRIKAKETAAFKIRIGLGYLLQDITTGFVKYFTPSNNQLVIDTPRLIQTDSDSAR